MESVARKWEMQEIEREVRRFEWEGDYRPAVRRALKELLEGRMAAEVSAHLEAMEAAGLADRRNGSYERHVLTEVGDVVLAVARTRRMSAKGLLAAYQRRSEPLDRALLACFVLGASTRKAGAIFAELCGERVSAETVSRVAKQLDGLVSAYHRRPLKDRYRFLFFDGVVLKRKTGAGSQKRVVLVALGILPDGRKEVIDFGLAQGESEAAWSGFLNDLYRRGLFGEALELIVTDGGAGLLAALPLVYPHVPVQRCWAHKTRNVLDRVKKNDQPAVKKDLHAISHAPNLACAQHALKRFQAHWAAIYPTAWRGLFDDIESLLNFYRIRDPKVWTQIRTTNAIERRFVEVRRRTRPMGVFSDRTSMERILYAVFAYENKRQTAGGPFLLTQTI